MGDDISTLILFKAHRNCLGDQRSLCRTRVANQQSICFDLWWIHLNHRLNFKWKYAYGGLVEVKKLISFFIVFCPDDLDFYLLIVLINIIDIINVIIILTIITIIIAINIINVSLVVAS